jgi:hypothetical protein
LEVRNTWGEGNMREQAKGWMGRRGERGEGGPRGGLWPGGMSRHLVALPDSTGASLLLRRTWSRGRRESRSARPTSSSFCSRGGAGGWVGRGRCTWGVGGAGHHCWGWCMTACWMNQHGWWGLQPAVVLLLCSVLLCCCCCHSCLLPGCQMAQWC